ncbi:hypothetical protein A1O3_05754 [Capronia epimyces CBS 606.96]|uniref:Urea active transporter n=1 Tax=Capronia epimyces CBS 606.96 TaxID=1182542 RepID=W9YS18_9EURO|nr:uncharacterized protein A1O3_05754 [Capronia epimyces CBS 606.96]EXJ85079.1 hypothetical protein A1O3_05754 [Capronia epimyces CBS 606.96]
MSGLSLGYSGDALVSQGTAYGLICGLGVAFCGVILVAIKVQRLYLAEDSGTSEMFMVANRSVGTGLTASAVFSSWMWINETVFAAVQCYRFGISIPMWWGVGLCFQIALMAALGVLAKIRVPYAHTSLEIIRQRYGKIGHVVFIVLNLCNNVFGCASMILTGSQIIHGTSGMHFAAATILIPLGVVLYTAIGGLKATFLTDFLHTTVALILIIYFTLATLTNKHVGGLYGLYDKIQATAAANYVPGNYKGSLLTFKSKQGIIFSLLIKFGNLALVVMDTAFWQKSFATEVDATVPGYNLAALAIFGIPWGLGTVIGLTARALHQTPIWPTYPAPLTAGEVSSGLVMPYVLKALVGNSGLIAFFVLLFMALTSTISSSMIAVSSILSFDIYKTYVNPKVTDKRLVHISHLAVIAHAVFIVAISLALNYGGADMTWIGYFRPILACPGIFPLIFSLTWRGQTRYAAILSPILGFITGIICWLVSTKTMYGHINLFTTEQGYPSLYGACGSLFSPAIYSVLISLYRPYQFDWREFLRVELLEEVKLADTPASESDDESSSQPEPERKSVHESVHPVHGLTPIERAVLRDPEHIAAHEEKSTTVSATAVPSSSALEVSLDDIKHPFDDETLRQLHRWHKIAWIFFAFIVLVTFVAWPMPLYRNYIFTKSFFSGWTTVAITWTFFAFFAVVVFPLYDGRHAIAKGTRGVWKAISSWLVRGKK